MKESNFYSDDFEQLIREKTEQYKMYPSERVWKGVHNSLHTKRRWFIGAMSFLVTGILFLAGRELIAPSTHPTALRKSAATAGSTAEATKPAVVSDVALDVPHAPLIAYHSPAATSSAVRHTAATDELTEDEQDPAYTGISITLHHPVVTPADLSTWLPKVVQLPDHAPDLTVLAARTPAEAGGSADEGLKPVVRPGAENMTKDATEIGADNGNVDASGFTARNMLESLDAKSEQARNNSRNRLAGNRRNAGAVTADGLLPDSVGAAHKASATAIAESEDRQRVNWLHDYALNSLPQPTKRGRTFFQLYLSPTASYRVLSGVDPAYEKLVGGPGTITTVQPGDKMNNSAAYGFEFGGSVLYRVTRNLSVKGGLQFNFSRYKINAWSVGSAGSTNPTSYYWYVTDSMRRNMPGQQQASSPSSSGGSAVNQLTLNNDYFQLSAPIGFELRILGNERLQFNLGATVQPSYLIGATAYMLDVRQEKYIQEPNKYRKWNVSGGLEAFLSYRTGDIRWQIGPEFRYQLFSTYTSENAVNENLKSYGIKIGITKMLP